MPVWTPALPITRPRRAASIQVGLTGARGVGVFLYRSAPGTGTVNFQNVKLKWHYGDDAVPDTARVSVDASAIEMVYVPEGAFFVGDGDTTASRRADSAGAPFQIAGAGPIPVGTQAGKLSWRNSINGHVLSSATTYLDVPATFPNGFGAFYCMKYEPSQGERAEAANKSGPLVGSSGTRQTWNVAGNTVSASSPERAARCFGGSSEVNYALAYLDWAGLRPMTEFEYEKACRGPSAPVVGEYAWGSNAVAAAPYTLGNDGTASEAVTAGYRTDAGNAWTLSTRTESGPCRVGMFALGSYTGAASPRIQSGATYYGAMDMTGNVGELVVSWPFSNAASPGFVFAGDHGDGSIVGSAHDVAAWGALALSNSLAKGGSYSSLSYSPVSYVYTASGYSYGYPFTFRGVRTAP